MIPEQYIAPCKRRELSIEDSEGRLEINGVKEHKQLEDDEAEGEKEDESTKIGENDESQLNDHEPKIVDSQEKKLRDNADKASDCQSKASQLSEKIILTLIQDLEDDKKIELLAKIQELLITSKRKKRKNK